MTGPRRPIALRPGALRALLRQPDLPPDLVAKITERAGDLTRAEEARDAAAVSGWGGLRRRLPIMLGLIAALVVTAGIAFVLSPVPPVAAPVAADPASEDVSEEPVEPVLSPAAPVASPVPGALPLTGAGQVASPQGNPSGVETPAQPAVVGGRSAVLPAQSADGRGTAQASRAAQSSGVTAPASKPAAGKSDGAQPVRAGQASSPQAVSPTPAASARPAVPASTAVSAPSGGGVPVASEDAAPAAPVSVPTVVPLVEVPSQP